MDCFKSNGNEIKVVRQIGQFKTLKIFDKINVNLKQGSEYRLEIVAGKNLISNISTNVTNEALVIKNDNKCNFVRGYKNKIVVNLTVPLIDTVVNWGVGTIIFNETFNQTKIFIQAKNVGDTYLNGVFKKINSVSHGAGNMYVNGICDTLLVYTFGSNSFHGEDLIINSYTFLENVSVGNCHINAPNNGVLSCSIWRNGNVYYKGNPSTIVDYSDGSAKGKLIKE